MGICNWFWTTILRSEYVSAGDSTGASTDFTRALSIDRKLRKVQDFEPFNRSDIDQYRRPVVVERKTIERTIIEKPSIERQITVVGAHTLSPTQLAELNATPLCSKPTCEIPSVFGRKLCLKHGSNIRRAQRARHAAARATHGTER